MTSSPTLPPRRTSEQIMKRAVHFYFSVGHSAKTGKTAKVRIGGVAASGRPRLLTALLALLSVSSVIRAQNLPDTAETSAVWTGDSMILWGGFEGNPPIVVNTGWSLDPVAGVWTALPDAPLTARTDQVAVWTGREIILWSGDTALGGVFFSDGALYNPLTMTWRPMTSSMAPTPRNGQGVWTGSRMLVWGGYNADSTISVLGEGGQYDPAADAWTSISTVGAPENRNHFTPVWTGSELVVWGGDGHSPPYELGDGARYNPLTDSWVPMGSNGTLSRRSYHSSVWTGDELIIWGGWRGGQGLPEANDGARYNPATDRWMAIAGGGAPSARRSHSAVWTGTEMIVWGGATGPGDGSQVLGDGARYNPLTDTWSPISSVAAPTARFGHIAIWTGSKMIIWGGSTVVNAFGFAAPGGGAYDPVADTWTPITDTLNPVPSIASEPQDQTVVVGQPATLSIVAQGANPLTFQWQSGTNAVPGATNSSYLIFSAQFSDAGAYAVIVSNAYGVVTSTIAVLTVIPGVPPSITLSPQSQTVQLGNTVNFSMNAAGSQPLKVQWFKGGEDIPGATNLNYSLLDVKYADAGWYSVAVSNGFGRAVSANVQLIVLPSTPYTFTTIPSATFSSPFGVAVDNRGNLFISDAYSNAIYKISLDRTVRRIAGSPTGQAGYLDGAGDGVLFNGPAGVALDQIGNLFVADAGNQCIRKITANGITSTLAGTPLASGWMDGASNVAQFSFPAGVAVGTTGFVYVADSGNDAIRQVTPGGTVTTLAGNGIPGAADGMGAVAQFNYPGSVAVDGFGNLYVADTANNTIRKMTLTGTNWTVNTLAGQPGLAGSTDGSGSAALFYDPEAIAVDYQGNLYVADTYNNTIRKISTNGVVATIAGLPQFDTFGNPLGGDADGTGSAALFNYPEGIAVDTGGNVDVVDSGNGIIRRGFPAPIAPFLSGLNPGAGPTPINLNGRPMTTYVLQAAAALGGPWQSVSTNTTANDGTLTFLDPVGSGTTARFYRVLGQ